MLAKKAIKKILKDFNIGITTYRELEYLQEHRRSIDDLQLLTRLPHEHATEIVQNLSRSHSQLRQDLFVLSELNFKRNGYFVEFGATDGVELSNTYLLETEYDWRGIVAEPAKCWHDQLRSNRECHIETDCIWSESGASLEFNETKTSEFSTIDTYTKHDTNKLRRKIGKKYQVSTISLYDMLEKYGAPKTIDYLSIDTEGSEFQILESFDFDKYKFRVITCEHNFTDMREQIFDLLASQGYARKLEVLSNFDDWYINTTV